MLHDSAIPAIPVAGGFVLDGSPTARSDGIPAAAAAAALIGVVFLTRAEREGWAFVLTCVAVIATVVLLFASLFPNVMPSTLDPAYSLTIENASSSPYTLKVMTWAAAFMTPVVIIYQGWTYWVPDSASPPSRFGVDRSTFKEKTWWSPNFESRNIRMPKELTVEFT